MNKVIDFIRLLKLNYSTDIIYFERIVESEIGKPCEIFILNDKVELFHKVTGSSKGFYEPSYLFNELANAFIQYNKPSLKFNELEQIKLVFSKHKIKS